ncbi:MULTISPECIES: WXG100 family type VII secretion target [unclassified Schaalia]|uniref:WXG100 family type VII secretion target n=1 Tax=unclassified Schaalia TaxID=2691889 RepID=UPI001E4900DA|nr:MULTISPECIES: WXG100 family type VII secretion target [unclassified Schaalia]MCD4549917.1 WXG100 family type VII secretion target [Schaalia sp. lx-260]MCD4557727.1 WXG100 family type VII secretion target [Schaalia sp. lx-100]
MAIFTVDSERVAQAAAQVSTTSERIRAEVSAMLAQLIDLQASWSGIAQSQCAQAVEQWQGTQIHVEQVLDTISQQLLSAAHVYSDAESRSAALFS